MFGAGDPNNPMGRLLGDLMKVLSPGPGTGGGGDTWFEAARTLAHGVATDGGPEENADPLVRMAFEELGRVAELHVTNATGISLSSGGSQLSFDTVGPGQWSFLALEAYRPTLQLMVEAQQQAAAAAPSPSTDLTDLDDPDRRPRRFLEPVRPHARARAARHAVRLGGRPPGPTRLRAVRPPAPVARIEHAGPGAGQRGPVRRGLEPAPPGSPALGLRPRAHHARRDHPPRGAGCAPAVAGGRGGPRRRVAAVVRRPARRRTGRSECARERAPGPRVPPGRPGQPRTAQHLQRARPR